MTKIGHKMQPAFIIKSAKLTKTETETETKYCVAVKYAV